MQPDDPTPLSDSARQARAERSKKAATRRRASQGALAAAIRELRTHDRLTRARTPRPRA
jgi:hypothetical protein